MPSWACFLILAPSRQIDGESLEVSKRAVGQRALMCGAQDYARRLICVKCLLPPRCTQTPTVAWLEPGKAKVRHWRGKIIAPRFRKREKRISHHGTDRMTTDILPACVAAAVAIKARHRFD
jgi:hypothetical protein